MTKELSEQLANPETLHGAETVTHACSGASVLAIYVQIMYIVHTVGDVTVD